MGETKLNRFIAYVLAFCMFVSGIFVSDYGMLTAWAAENTTEVDEEATEEESSASQVKEEKVKVQAETTKDSKDLKAPKAEGDTDPEEPGDGATTTVYCLYNGVKTLALRRNL